MIKRTKKIIALLLIFTFCLAGCASETDTGSDQVSDAVTGEAVSGNAVSETAADLSEASPTPDAPPPGFKQEVGEKYVHGDDGYYNLADDGITVNERVQKGGTCWLFSAAVTMETGCQRLHDKLIEVDPMPLLKQIYGDNKAEGYFIKGADAKNVGGVGFIVIDTLANGFGDGLVVDGSVEATDFTPEEMKEGIKKYGALNVGVPDTDPGKKGVFHGYSTINHVTDNPDDYDHAVAFIGWDDHFPRDYFKDPASQDGAWIAYNSLSNGGYFYYSYDMLIEREWDKPSFMSVTDEYSHVESYDVGNPEDISIRTGKETTVGNVFHKKGTLAAVGTYCLKKSQSIEIKIYDAKFKKCLYTQSAELDHKGYHTIRLDEPQEVEDYALVIRYTGAAPVEGDGWKEKDEAIYRKTTCKKGQSFVLLDDKWKDLSDKETIRELGCKHKPHNCNIKALYS